MNIKVILTDGSEYRIEHYTSYKFFDNIFRIIDGKDIVYFPLENVFIINIYDDIEVI